MKARIVFCFSIAAMLVAPRSSDAYFDWIWELSGPSMFGTGWYCSVGIKDGDENVCDEQGGAVFLQRGVNTSRVSLTLMGTYYFTVAKNPIDAQIYAVLPEASLEVAILRDEPFRLYSGVGFTYGYFFSSAFDNFSNPALKLTLAGFEVPIPERRLVIKGWANYRWFRDKFNNADPGNPIDQREGSLSLYFGVAFQI